MSQLPFFKDFCKKCTKILPNFELSFTSILREKPLLIQQPENAYAEAPLYTSFALPWVPIAQDPLNIPTAETENKPIGKD